MCLQVGLLLLLVSAHGLDAGEAMNDAGEPLVVQLLRAVRIYNIYNIYVQYLHQVHSLLPGSESHDWETVVRNAEEYSRTYTRLDRYLPHPHGILGFFNFYIDTNTKYLN